MQRTVLQIPMSKDLKENAEKAAFEQGFSSLQEMLRVFMKKAANKKIDFSFHEKDVQLSPKAAKRYTKIIQDIESGKEKIYTAKNAEDLLKQLHAYSEN